MFKAQREQILQRSVFRPFAVNVLDAWKDEKGSCSVEYKTDSFRPEFIPHWLEYQGEFSRRRPKTEMGPKVAGVIRLLLCETPQWHPLSFSMKKDQFCAVEKEFDLPAATLPMFESRGSVHTWSIEGDRFYFVMKVQQQNPIANYGLSFCHRLKTGITTGILYGLNLTCQQEWYGTGYSGASRVDEFLPQLKELGHLIDHPLLFPILLLSCDIRRAQHFCMTEMEPRLLQVEEALRVTRPGQIMGKIDTLLHEQRDEDGQYTPLPFDEDKPYYQRKPKIIKLMTEINTLTTESLIALCVPSWQTRFAEFLATFFDDSTTIDSFPHEHPSAKELKNMMNHFASAAANNMDYMQQLKSRMELQLQVLYQFMTQTDNHLNATLAAAATRDSSAMKTLAFLTALFLPGTYVATLFSMNMFNWSGSNDSDGGGNVKKTSVSSSFWIYWIVTGVLTCAIIGGWRLWWKKENRQYKEQYKTFLGFLDKKNDEQSSGKDEGAYNGYRAAREESEDDENDEDNNARALGKLRGGAGDNPDNWLTRAGHALGLDHLDMRSNRSITDGGTRAGAASTQSDLAVDVEAGLERPTEDVEIDCSDWAEQQQQQPPEQRPPEEKHLTVPPKNRRRCSQIIPARHHHHHPYYLNRLSDRPATSRTVSSSQSGSKLTTSVNIPPLTPPPPPPHSTDPLSSRSSDASPNLPQVSRDEITPNPTAGSETHPSIKQYWSINRPPGRYLSRTRCLPTPPPGAKRWISWCRDDDYGWVDGPGMKEQMGAEVWEYMKLVQQNFKHSSAGRNLQRFVEQTREPLPLFDRLEGQEQSDTDPGTVWTMSSKTDGRESRIHLPRPPGAKSILRCGNEDSGPLPLPLPPGARELLQNADDKFRWLDDADVKKKMGEELWDYMKSVAETRREVRLPYETFPSIELPRPKEILSRSQPVLGGPITDAENKKLLENEQDVDHVRAFDTPIKLEKPEQSDDEELYSLPQPPNSSSKTPQSPVLPAGPLEVVPGQLERRSSLILSPHLSNDLDVCSPRFPTCQEPFLSPESNNHDNNSSTSNGNNPPPPNLPDEPSPEAIQQRVFRLSTHPPANSRLSDMGLQAQQRDWSAPQIKRSKEWRLGALARQWCRLQQRQLQRHHQRANGGEAVVGLGQTQHHVDGDSDGDGASAATAAAAATRSHQISPLSPIPPIRLEDVDIDVPEFDKPVPFPASRSDGAIFDVGQQSQQQQQPHHQLFADSLERPRNGEEQVRMRTSTRRQMDRLRAMAREAEGEGKAGEEGQGGERAKQARSSKPSAAAAAAAAAAASTTPIAGGEAPQRTEHSAGGK